MIGWWTIIMLVQGDDRRLGGLVVASSLLAVLLARFGYQSFTFAILLILNNWSTMRYTVCQVGGGVQRWTRVVKA